MVLNIEFHNLSIELVNYFVRLSQLILNKEMMAGLDSQPKLSNLTSLQVSSSLQPQQEPL